MADALWEGLLAATARGERVVLDASEGESLVGTVTLRIDCPPNQPPRAEIAKMMARVSRMIHCLAGCDWANSTAPPAHTTGPQGDPQPEAMATTKVAARNPCVKSTRIPSQRISFSVW